MSSSSPSDLRDIGAAFLAHEIGEPLRQFALVGVRKGAIQHVGDDQPEHVVAEKFEPLIAVGALARGFQRRDMRERGRQQLWIGELVADARLERRDRRLGAGPCRVFFFRRRSFAAGFRLAGLLRRLPME